jgi:hypothetical protein
MPMWTSTHPPSARLVAALALAVALALPPAAPVGAQVPACDLQAAETVACIAGRSCRCRLAPASAMTGLPEGFRWDCGTLRPACGDPRPATLDAYTGPLPEALSIDRSRTTVTTVTGDPHRPRDGHDGPGGHPDKEGHGRKDER